MTPSRRLGLHKRLRAAYEALLDETPVTKPSDLPPAPKKIPSTNPGAVVIKRSKKR